MVKEILKDTITDIVKELLGKKFLEKTEQRCKEELSVQLASGMEKFISRHEGTIVSRDAFLRHVRYYNVLEKIYRYALEPEAVSKSKKADQLVSACLAYLRGEGIPVSPQDACIVREFMLQQLQAAEDWSYSMLGLKDSIALSSILHNSAKIQEGIDLQLRQEADAQKGQRRPAFGQATENRKGNKEETELLRRLEEALEAEKERSPSLQLIQIDAELLPEARLGAGTAMIKDRSGRTVPFRHYLEQSWKKEQNHISITGIGGLGKTVSLLTISGELPMIYVPLRNLPRKDEDTLITDYIRENTLAHDEAGFRKLMWLCRQNWTKKGPRLLLLLDGVNEAPLEIRKLLLREIETVWSYKRGIQIIITSRYDIRSEVRINHMAFLEFQTLQADKIRLFLRHNKIDPPEAAGKLWSVIDTPLMLNLYVRSEIMRKQARYGSAHWLPNSSAGAIIWNYLQCELCRYQYVRGDILTCAAAAEWAAPYIAYCMMKDNIFTVSRDVFCQWLRRAVRKLREGIQCRRLPSHLYRIMQEEGKDDIQEIKLFSLLTKDMCLFQYTGNTLQLMHQHFRDCLAAIHIVQSAETNDGSALPEEWKEPFDQYVMEFLADLLQTETGPDRSRGVWNQIWSCAGAYESGNREFTDKMLYLYKAAYGKDLSEIDFSGRDLTGVSLDGCRLTEKSRNHFRNARISENTFFGKGHKMTVCSVSWCPDGTRFLSASYDCTLRIWKEEGRNCAILPQVHSHYIRCAKWCPADGNRLASGGDDRKLILWQSGGAQKEGWTPRVLGSCEDWIRSLAWSGDGLHIVCGDRSGNIVLFDMAGRKKCFRRAHSDNVRHLVWSPSDKNLFVSGSDDGTVCIWDIGRDEPVRTLQLKEEITSAGWACSGKYLVVTDKERVLLADYSKLLQSQVQTWEREARPEFAAAVLYRDEISSAAAASVFNRDDIAVCYKNSVEIVSILDDGDQPQLYTVARRRTDALAFQKIVCTAWDRSCGRLVCGTRDGSVCLLYVSGEEASAERITIETVGNRICVSARCSGWSSDGTLLAAGYDDGMIRIWDWKRRCCVKVLAGHSDSVKGLAWSPDDRCLVSGSDDASVRVWKLDIPENTPGYVQIKSFHSAAVNCVLWLDDGRIVSGSDDKTIRIWEPGTDTVSRPLQRHTKRVYSMAPSPDGTLLVSAGNDRKLCLWDLQLPECRQCIDSGHTEPVRGVAWQKEGTAIVTASNDNRLIVREFDPDRGLIKKEFRRLVQEHADFIYSTAISGHGRYIVSGSTDSGVGFWDLQSGSLLAMGKEHKDFVWNISGGKTGEKYFAASSSSDGTVKIWDVTEITGPEIHPFAEWKVIPGVSIAGCDFTGAVIETEELRALVFMNGGVFRQEEKGEG